jgi:hypothetical protein
MGKKYGSFRRADILPAGKNLLFALRLACFRLQLKASIIRRGNKAIIWRQTGSRLIKIQSREMVRTKGESPMTICKMIYNSGFDGVMNIPNKLVVMK